MTNVFGPDVSFYQDDDETPRQIDFMQMKKNGASFVIIRAGQRSWPDVDFAYNWHKGKEAGLPRGSYWFYDSREDPAKQANLFASMLSSDTGELPIFADFEDSYGGEYKGWYHWRTFLERLKFLLPDKEIAIYTAYYYWKDNTPSDARAYFAQYPLWIANYDVKAPLVPPPWNETDENQWLFWQYTEKGPGRSFGAESNNIDLNYFNGDLEAFNKRFNLKGSPTPPPVPVNTVTAPYKGVTVHSLDRFGTKVKLVKIDLQGKRFRISGEGFATVSQAAKKYGAQIIVNGDGWAGAKMRVKNVPNSIAVSDGQVKQLKRYDYRPWINISKDNEITFGNPDSAKGLYNAVSGDRYLVMNGQFDTRISDRRTKNARTAIGVDQAGLLILMVADGDDSKSIGLTFPEMAQVLIEFGCKTSINLDGGGSTAMWLKDRIVNHPNDDNYYGPSSERHVVNHVLIFIPEDQQQPDTDPDPQPSISLGALLAADAQRLADVQLQDHVHQLEQKFPDVFKEEA
jgi:GH25 family lysozyme M1 (1,4-beta-N-acetylmuramidase)